jgi:hypothetical protein
MGPYLDRRQVKLHPLAERENRVRIEEAAAFPGDRPRQENAELDRTVAEMADEVKRARSAGAPVVIAFGAHTIKNGMGPLLGGLIEAGWVTHLATNGAGIIHDWEFAFQGESSEHVERNVHSGRFGLWEETGFYLNLAIAVGAFEGRGYGESVGALVENEGLTVPTEGELEAAAREVQTDPERAGAAADLLALMGRLDLEPGRVSVAHPFRRYGLQAAAYRIGVPFTSHPMFGHDIIYCHPANYGAAIGRAAERDFLSFAESISRIDGGVYLSVGSAVMSPMIFEKSFAMAQNLALQAGRRIENHRIDVVDLAGVQWDWSAQGEPSEDDPAYYMRFLKTFSRMGGHMQYVAADNRELLLRLALVLGVGKGAGTEAAGKRDEATGPRAQTAGDREARREPR